MASRESVNEVFPPNKENCLKYICEQRSPDEVTRPHCSSADTINQYPVHLNDYRRFYDFKSPLE